MEGFHVLDGAFLGLNLFFLLRDDEVCGGKVVFAGLKLANYLVDKFLALLVQLVFIFQVQLLLHG